MRFFWILWAVIFLVTSSAFADTGDIVKKVRKALDILTKEQCSLDTFQEKMDFFCQTVSGKDAEEFGNCFKKKFPCADVASDLSSMTTYINGKSYTLQMNIINIACGKTDFSFIPSDGCMTLEDLTKATNSLEKTVNQTFDAVAKCVDGMLPWYCPVAVARNHMEEQLNYVKSLLGMSLINYTMAHPCDSQCQDGRDSKGFVTQECCTQKGWIFLTKNDNKNYCCPPKDDSASECPMNQTPDNQCISSCRVGTNEINGECCPENRISQMDGVLECCPAGQSPSSPTDDNNNSICCPTGQKALSTQKGDCCDPINIVEENGKKTCCPSERAIIEPDKTICCSENEVKAESFMGYHKMCCPTSKLGKDSYGTKYDQSRLYCCDGDSYATNGHCCFKGEIWIDEK